MDAEEPNVSNPKSKKLIILIAVVILAIAAVVVTFFFRAKIRATTMRILKLHGEVSLEENGAEKQVKESLRLKDGNALNTEEESYVSVGLDESKIITLNEKSRAEFTKKGKLLDLSLTKGSLYFDVNKPLKDDETFNIRTSTMVVGIRGTSGLVTNDEEGETLIVTDGHVHVVGTNPVTGEVKEIDVYAGQKIVVYLYNDRKVDSIEFMLAEVTERDLPEFALRYLREHSETLDRVVKATGWDKPWILNGDAAEEKVPRNITYPATADNGNSDNGSENGEGGSGGSTSETDVNGSGSAGSVEDGYSEEAGDGDGSASTEDTVDGNAAGAGSVLTAAQLAEGRSAIVFTNNGNGVVLLADGTLFDPVYYAAANPEVAASYGSSTEALVYHYLHRGKAEGRPPIAPSAVAAKAEETVVHFDPNANNENSSSDSDDDDDDDDDDSGDPGSITPPPPPPAMTGDVDGNGNITVNGTTIGRVTSGGQYAMVVTTGNEIDLPLEITDTNGAITTISSLTEIDFNGSLSVYSYVKDTVAGITVQCTTTSSSTTGTKIYKLTKGSYYEDNVNNYNIDTKINEFYARP